ncbi:MAG TPA: DUF4956 domain-containing protein [Longimicrobiales bacterium]
MTPGIAGRSPSHSQRHVPLVRLLVYYAVVVGIAAALVTLVPAIQRAFVSPIVLPAVSGPNDLVTQQAPQLPGETTLQHTIDRALTTALVTIGTLLLVLPVAWVYMFTRRFRYDRALVQSVIVLPLVVGGMVMIVKNSLALAFSLAGIVAAVRFRNTLKDPRDAVYIFLALGLGLSAGVQALDIALVMSLSFNLVVLALWRFNLGAVYGGPGERDMMAMGSPKLRQGRTAEERRRLGETFAAQTDGMQSDGVLLVQGADPAAARAAADAALSRAGKEWKFMEPTTGTDGVTLLPVLVRFKKKGTPVQVLSELDEYWSRHVASAEYIPFAAEEKGEGDE